MLRNTAREIAVHLSYEMNFTDLPINELLDRRLTEESFSRLAGEDPLYEAAPDAMTGETGAGKSIVIDALGAVLGGRTSRDLIRTGAEKAFVSAEFSQIPASLPALERNGIQPDEEGTLLLQRELTADGRNTCRVNGRPITVAQLREVGGELLNIHGQHDGQQLLDEERHADSITEDTECFE